jgi:hypothetical protein
VEAAGLFGDLMIDVAFTIGIRERVDVGRLKASSNASTASL